MSTSISSTTLSQPERLTVPEKLFGPAFLKLELYVYCLTDTMAPSYKGAYWNMYRLSNGGFYMAPDVEHSFVIECINHYVGEVSADALGVIVCLCAFSHLSFRLPEQHARVCAEHYHLLRAYALEHPEVAEIFAAID